MPINQSKYIWHHNEMVPWDQATVHVMSHGFLYGSSVFEGIRAYEINGTPTFYRLGDHMKRLYESARIHRMEVPFSQHELEKACHQVVARNDLKAAYIRPTVYQGLGAIGLINDPGCVRVSIAAFPFGAYLGEDSMRDGIEVGVSSWQRPAPNTGSTIAKAAGNYLSSILMSEETKRHGYTEAIALDSNGLLSEGPGENLFIIRDGVIHTPAIHHSLLLGITRDSVIRIARSLGYTVVEQSLPREMLYLADELFFTGTATEVVPIRRVDGLTVGNGSGGPITRAIQKVFFSLLDGTAEDQWGWLEALDRTHQ